MTLENTSMKNFIAIPDIISLLNMSSGFLAIIFAINENLVISSSLIILAVMFDSVDGWVARKTNRKDELEFGKNIDSLSDIISFGIAPAIFIYKSINATSNLLNLSSIIVCLLIVICGVLRLTRYNVIANKTKAKDFIGFPIPGIAIIIATFYLSGLFNTYGRQSPSGTVQQIRPYRLAGRSFSYRTVSRLVKLMCPVSPSTYRPFYVHLERIVPSASAVQHARAVYAALPRSSLRLSTAPALLSSDGKSSSI